MARNRTLKNKEVKWLRYTMALYGFAGVFNFCGLIFLVASFPKGNMALLLIGLMLVFVGSACDAVSRVTAIKMVVGGKRE